MYSGEWPTQSYKIFRFSREKPRKLKDKKALKYSRIYNFLSADLFISCVIFFFFNVLSASILYCSCLQNSIPFTSTENLTTLQQFELKLYLELTIRGCLNLTVEASEIYISFCFFCTSANQARLFL